MWGASWISNTPITEVNSLVSLIFLLFLGAGFGAYRWIRTRVSHPLWRMGLYFAVCFGIGLIAAEVGVPVEPHPPMRLFPLFASQLLFGLQDFSFRFPGIVAVSVLSFLTYRLVVRRRPESAGFAFFAGFSIYMIPTVFHVSAIVQPSIWGFAAAVGCLYALYEATERQDDGFVILASIIVGLGTLFRQSAILLWPVFWLIAFANRRWIRRWGLIAAPMLFAVPYFLTVAQIGHPAADGRILHELSPAQSVFISPSSGIGPWAIVRSSTLWWLLFGVAGSLMVLRRTKTTLKIFYLVFITGYMLFHSISPDLWGLGRYQAEFVAPCFVLTIFLLALDLGAGERFLFVLCLVFLGSYSFFCNLTIPQDIHYERWPQKRISTESYYPYKQALGFLERQETGGRFIIVGGVPIYGRMILWLRGFSASETENWWRRQTQFGGLLKNPMSVSDFIAFLRASDTDYYLIQYGDKRELQHRSPNMQALLDGLTSEPSGTLGKPSEAYARQQTFIGNVEGAIDLYGKTSLRYGGFLSGNAKAAPMTKKGMSEILNR
jgi:hypothetical protein